MAGVDLALDPGHFRRRYDEHRDRAGKNAKGAMTYLLGLAREATEGRFDPTKTAVAERLAERLLDDLHQRGEGAVADRPILSLLASVIHVT